MATCRGFAAMHYWHEQWAVWLAECMPSSNYNILDHWCTDATDSPMFSLAPMLPISDVQIGLTLLADNNFLDCDNNAETWQWEHSQSEKYQYSDKSKTLTFDKLQSSSDFFVRSNSPYVWVTLQTTDDVRNFIINLVTTWKHTCNLSDI